MTRPITGIIPVMLTPFTPDNQIDWPGYERLIDWYIGNGAEQRSEPSAMAETGVDGVVLVTNRLAPPEDDSQILRDHIDALLSVLPPDLPLGLYECPVLMRVEHGAAHYRSRIAGLGGTA